MLNFHDFLTQLRRDVKDLDKLKEDKNNLLEDINFRDSDVDLMLSLIRYSRKNIAYSLNSISKIVRYGEPINCHGTLITYNDAKVSFYSEFPNMTLAADLIYTNIEKLNNRMFRLEQMMASITDKISIIAELMSDSKQIS